MRGNVRAAGAGGGVLAEVVSRRNGADWRRKGKYRLLTKQRREQYQSAVKDYWRGIGICWARES